MSFLQRLQDAQAHGERSRADPWQRTLAPALRGVNAISSVALLDLLDVRKTTGNARRLATNMRALGFVPLKSRRLAPGGFKDTCIRGWMRALRENRASTPLNMTAVLGGSKQGGTHGTLSS